MLSQEISLRRILERPLNEEHWPQLELISKLLEEHVKKCSTNRQYKQAQRAKQKLSELHRQYKLRNIKQLQNRYHQLLEQLNSKHKVLRQQQHDNIQYRIGKCNTQYHQLFSRKQAKHGEEKKKHIFQLQMALPDKHTPDKELQRLKWQEAHQAKLGKFLQAQKYKEMFLNRQHMLQQEHQIIRQNNIKLMVKQLEEKQENQLKFLKIKHHQALQQIENDATKHKKDLLQRQQKQIREVKWMHQQAIKKYQ